MPVHLIVDSHEDIAFNMLCFGRDYSLSALETRRREIESASANTLHNGEALLGWPEYLEGKVAFVFATLFVAPERLRDGDWEKPTYSNFEQAHHHYMSELEIYYELCDRHPDKFRMVLTKKDLEATLTEWDIPADGTHPVGLVPLMEGAEGVRSPSELDMWWDKGLRMIGPAWGGTRYCGGTREPGPLTEDGRALLKGMAEVGFALDISHMDSLAAREALDIYPGVIMASHANAASLLPGYTGNRLLPDDVIKGLISRDAIIGVVPYCMFLKTGWMKGDSREGITLDTLVDHIDHICQMAGNAHHAGLGSDFEGGFGLNAVPTGLDTIADLQKIGKILEMRGYNDEDVAAIFGMNWLRHLTTILP
jgi:membrane dipeptidase